jgi:hypothetical protein
MAAFSTQECASLLQYAISLESRVVSSFTSDPYWSFSCLLMEQTVKLSSVFWKLIFYVYLYIIRRYTILFNGLYAPNIHFLYFIVSKKEGLCSFVRMWAGTGMFDMVQRFLQDPELFQHFILQHL